MSRVFHANLSGVGLDEQPTWNIWAINENHVGD